MRKIALSLLVVAASGAYVWSQSGSAISDDPLGPLPPLGPQSALGSEPRLGPEPRTSDIQTGSVEKRQPLLVDVPATLPPRLQPAGENEWSEDGEDDSALGRLFAGQPADGTPASPIAPAPSAMAAPDVVLVPVAPPPPPPAQDAAAASPPDPFALTALPAAPTMPDPSAPPPVMEARLPRPRPAYQPPVASPVYQPPVASAGLTRVAMNLAQSGRYKDGTYTGAVIDAFYGLIQIQAIVQGGQLVDINVLQYPSDRRLSVRINRYALPRLRDEAVSAQSANVDIISGATLTSEAFIRSIGTALRVAAKA